MPTLGGGGKGEGVSAPSGKVHGAAFGGAKYGILKLGRFWRISVCIAGRIQRVRLYSRLQQLRDEIAAAAQPLGLTMTALIAWQVASLTRPTYNSAQNALFTLFFLAVATDQPKFHCIT